MKSVAVVVLSWNRRDTVLECLDRVKRLHGAQLHTIVVDNASTDDSTSAIRRVHPDVTLLEEPVNGGFVGGVNRGLAEAARIGADYAWLLNDDTSFDDDILVPLLAFAEAHPQYGLLSPSLRDIDDDQVVQFSNGVIDWAAGEMLHNVTVAREREIMARGGTAIVAGTATLCDMRLYRAIGSFDQRFFAYWEDTDYSVRAERAGFPAAVVPDAVMRHASTPTRNHRPPHYHYYMVRNEAMFWRLHIRSSNVRSRRRGWRRRWLAGSLQSIAQNRDLGRTGNVDASIDGLWDALLHRHGPRSAHPPAPRWFRGILTSRPYLLFGLVEGRFGELAKRMFKRR